MSDNHLVHETTHERRHGVGDATHVGSRPESVGADVLRQGDPGGCHAPPLNIPRKKGENANG